MKRLRYWESVSIGWRILWQTIGVFVLALFLSSMAVLGLLPELTRTGPWYWALVVPLVIACMFAVRDVAVGRSRPDQRFLWDLQACCHTQGALPIHHLGRRRHYDPSHNSHNSHVRADGPVDRRDPDAPCVHTGSRTGDQGRHAASCCRHLVEARFVEW